MYLQLAWRNLWRNLPRTGITISAIMLAVFLSVSIKSMNEGTYDRMIDNMIGSYTGYVKVHKQGFWEEQSVDNSFALTDSLEQAILGERNITGTVPRVDGFALSSTGPKSRGVMLTGTDPEKENSFSGLKEKLVEGEYFSNNKEEVMIAEGYANLMGLDIGDTLVLLGQGYHGSMAAAKYPVCGIVKFGNPDLNKRMVYLPLNVAQDFFSLENQVTGIVIKIKHASYAESVSKSLQEKLGNNFESMSWFDMSPEIKNMIEGDRVEGYIFMGILYLVVGFGIFGTLVMMIAERQREFGVLMAIGMKKMRLAITVVLETLILALIGTLLGILAGMPLAFWMHYNPIPLGGNMQEMSEQYGFEAVIQASIQPWIFTQQAAVILIMTTFLTLYPFIKVLRMNEIKAMRS